MYAIRSYYDNFLGSGKRVSFAFNNSKVTTVYNFYYTDPYYTINGVSRGFGLFYKKTDADQANISSYTVITSYSIHYTKLYEFRDDRKHQKGCQAAYG